MAFNKCTILSLVLAGAACGRDGLQDAAAMTASDVHPRQPSLSPSDDHYAHYEGTQGRNNCKADLDCLISGCFMSTCAAEILEIADPQFCQERMATQAPQPSYSRCGCLNGTCLWYFETDYDRVCAVDSDCAGLGPPPQGHIGKSLRTCTGGQCRF
jgi:hypothetical protein